MTVSDQAREVLRQQAKEVLVAKYTQEATARGAPNRPVTFGSGTVGLDELDEWLAKLDRRAARWTKVTNIAVIILALTAIVITLIILSWFFVVQPHFTKLLNW
jgi:hypothetical protein